MVETSDIQQGTGAGLLEFLSWMGDKGLMNPRTAGAYKSACTKVLEIDADWLTTDVKALDVSAQIDRFARLNGPRYTPGSLMTYGQRFRSAVETYLDYLKSPAAFRGKPVAPPKKAVDRRSQDPQRPDRPSSAEPSRVHADLVTYPFPLRSGGMAYLQLPRELSGQEAKRLCAFVHSLAMDDRPALLPAEGSG